LYIIITGPTGTGKSSTAVELALLMNGEIISADSMQVYKGMDIGTYKITKTEMKGVKHHLIGIAEPANGFSAAQFKTFAEKAMDDIKLRGKLPIIAGGTGLYIHALTRGLMTAKEPTAEQKMILRVELEEGGLESLVNLLNKKDSEAAGMIDINNSRRVLRALELIEANKMTLKQLRATTEENRYKDDYKMFILETDREMMYASLDRRVDDMISRGLEKEVRSLMLAGLSGSDTAMQAIGYKETAQMIEGKIRESELKLKIKQATRNYAKRQITWFKKYGEAVNINMDKKTPAQAAAEIAKTIK
jgi:tRNA dimethylallyltransferase